MGLSGMGEGGMLPPRDWGFPAEPGLGHTVGRGGWPPAPQDHLSQPFLSTSLPRP